MSIDVVKFIEKYVADNGMCPISSKGNVADLVTKLRAAMETEYVDPLYRTDYLVSGQGAFPLDMLRYTQSWPCTEVDARAIETSIELATVDDPFTIRLTKYHRDQKPDLAEQRWSSKFRWRVVGTPETTEL